MTQWLLVIAMFGSPGTSGWLEGMNEYPTHKECHIAAMHLEPQKGNGRSYAFCVREERSLSLPEVREQEQP